MYAHESVGAYVFMDAAMHLVRCTCNRSHVELELLA